jgi:hypothetical protein
MLGFLQQEVEQSTKVILGHSPCLLASLAEGRRMDISFKIFLNSLRLQLVANSSRDSEGRPFAHVRTELPEGAGRCGHGLL